MNWRIFVLSLTCLVTALTAVERFEAGKEGFLLWAPAVTSLLSLAAVILMWRAGASANRQDRIELERTTDADAVSVRPDMKSPA